MPTSTVAAVPQTLHIDRSHSEVAFQVRHLLSKVRGRFADFSGTLVFDEANPAASHVEVVINAASVDTAERDRDKHLRTSDFFEIEKYPTLTFKSTDVQHRGGDSYDISGDLTIHGVTRPETLRATFLGRAADPWGNERVGFEGELTLNRKDYGLHWNAALEAGGFLVGDEVKVLISIQAK